MEAGTGSGSLITAQLAKKQGREVYAIPSYVGRSGAEGTNELLKDGAHMILESEDILERYQYIYASSLRLERLIEAKKNSSVDPAYLRSLDVAVFEVGEQKKNGAPYVKMTQSNERKPVEEKLREQYAQKNAPVGQFEQLSMLQPTEQVQNALPERGARVELTDTRARTVEFTKERPATAINRTSKTRSDPKTEKAEKQPSSSDMLATLSPVQLAIMEMIPEDRGISADAFSNLDYPYGEIVAALTMLEIMGLVEKLPGALYTKL